MYGLLHQARNAMTAHAHVLVLQRIVDARAAVPFFEAGIDRANLLQKLAIIAGLPTVTPHTPSMVWFQV
jgi:hypothetical protein